MAEGTAMAEMSEARVLLTAELAGEMTVEVAFVAGELPALMAEFDGKPGCPEFPDLVNGLASKLVEAYARGEDMTIPLAGMLWSAMRHPAGGDRVRGGISRMLREGEFAHVTWRYSLAGLLIGVGTRYFKIGEPLAVSLLEHSPICIEETEPEVVAMQ